ncbi:pantoate--beta-alanine ligase [Scopulibacillus daqui]|uniref:Pantothenate synthetase n=1 Tax=Scopulibacillus daqui TaxID=1469162 RepID=A0ABS2PZ87_9BACL|nr:pantoate--beta-alanine ligase [Scopulibacillus daqui]MBM7645263.1 pantoate--beta-alanine ligase [Scopulibacillus daqui]
MQMIYSAQEMNRTIQQLKEKGQTIGFVPTMGYLHEGHQSLIRHAKAMCDIVVLSIFVNPAQFGPNEDFETYPRDIKRDKIIAEKEGVNIVFNPNVDEMYPLGESMLVTVKDRVDVLCGSSRPGHFDGVATILVKLFNIVMPDKVFFGLKDAQQVAVVDSMIKNFHYPIQLVPCQTIREKDGLAKSSRNIRLSSDERKEAVHLYQGLKEGLLLVNKGERSAAHIKSQVTLYLETHLRLGKIDYVEVLGYPDLQSKELLNGRFIIACAVQYEHARLIDNIVANVNNKLEGEPYAANINEK